MSFLTNESLNSSIRLFCSWSRIIPNDVIDFLIQLFDRSILGPLNVTALHMVFNYSVHLKSNTFVTNVSLECVMMLDIPRISNLAERPIVLYYAKYFGSHQLIPSSRGRSDRKKILVIDNTSILQLLQFRL